MPPIPQSSNLGGRSITSEIRTGLRYFFAASQIRDFSGGLNLRDAPSELAENESPELMNVTFDERGGVVKRLGHLQLTSSLSNAPTNMFYSSSLGLIFVQDGATIKKTTDFSSFTSLTPNMTTTARVGMCEFKGELLIVHPVDGLFRYASGTALTAVAAGPKGFAIVPWQNKVHVAGDPAQKVRVYASGNGDATDWTVGGGGGAYTIDIREKDDDAITALGAGQGMDIAGRPTLLVFKKRSMHRINSSTTGAYTTLDVVAGAGGPLAVVSLAGKTLSVSDTGIWMTDGLSPPVSVSSKIETLFQPDQINFAQTANFVASAYLQRAIFSIPFGAAQTTNNLTLEYHPGHGWVTCHDFGYGCATIFTSAARKLYVGSPTTGKTYEAFKGWDDAGTPIASRYQTRWFEFHKENQSRLRRIRLAGRGAFQLYVKSEYGTGTGVLYNASLTGSGGVWDTAHWGTDVWGPSGYETYQDFWELGVGRSFAFQFKESSTTSATAPGLLLTGASSQVGSFAVYGLQFDTVPLGLS